MSTEIIIALIGILSTVISSWVSWFLTRRKQNSEVDNTTIQNMSESLEFYKKLSDDNKRRLDEVLLRNDQLEKEIEDLRNQMFRLMSTICVDLTCQLRKRDLKLFDNYEANFKKNKEE